MTYVVCVCMVLWYYYYYFLLSLLIRKNSPPPVARVEEDRNHDPAVRKVSHRVGVTVGINISGICI